MGVGVPGVTTHYRAPHLVLGRRRRVGQIKRLFRIRSLGYSIKTRSKSARRGFQQPRTGFPDAVLGGGNDPGGKSPVRDRGGEELTE